MSSHQPFNTLPAAPLLPALGGGFAQAAPPGATSEALGEVIVVLCSQGHRLLWSEIIRIPDPIYHFKAFQSLGSEIVDRTPLGN